MSKVCCVCNETKESKDNVIFNCKGQGCDVSVHQGCYGIVNVPTGLWFCRKCESQERAARVRCELCPRKEGALKRTDTGGWAHVVCALYIPEVVFGNNRVMEPIITTKLPRERFSKSCYICEERGNETQATYGACMSCHKPSCRQAFHVTCAQKERLLCEEEDSRDSRNVIYCGYCSTHHKKMLRQKLKQGRKPVFPSSTSASAPMFPTTPTSSSPGSATPLSSLPHDLAHPDGAGGHRLERTRSGSPLKGAVKRERPSLSDLPIKRTSTDSSISNPKAPKQRRKRKPSSSNESTTSEAPSNSSDFSLIPSSMVLPSPTPNNALGSPLMLPSVPSATGKGGDQKGRGGVGAGQHLHHEEEVMEVGQGGEQFVGAAGEMMVVDGCDRRVTSSSSSEQGSRVQAPPPRSLQELLERQWEQTAQFILDQAGKQNNAGSMLAHLHTLQSDNRSMQSRIMELASQREFYIAINTKLRQTLTEHQLGHLNGVQAVGNGLQQVVMGPGAGLVGVTGREGPVPEPTLMGGVEHKPHSSSRQPSKSDHTPGISQRGSGSHGGHRSGRDVYPSPPSHATPPPNHQPDSRQANSLSKDDQDMLLMAHFSSTSHGTTSSHQVTSKNATPPSPPTRDRSRHLHDHHTPHYHLGDQRGKTEGHLQRNSAVSSSAVVPGTFLPTLTQLGPTSSSTDPAPLVLPASGHAPIMEYPLPPSAPSAPMDTPPHHATSQDLSATPFHEITQVTNSVHAPISSLTPLPNEPPGDSPGYPGVFNQAPASYKKEGSGKHGNAL